MHITRGRECGLKRTEESGDSPISNKTRRFDPALSWRLIIVRMYAAEIFSERINADILAILARKNEKEIEREGALKCSENWCVWKTDLVWTLVWLIQQAGMQIIIWLFNGFQTFFLHLVFNGLPFSILNKILTLL